MRSTKLGALAAGCVSGIGAAYAAVLALGIAHAGFARPIADPILAVMEALTLLSAPAILVAIAALRNEAAPNRQLTATVSLAFATIFTGLTSAVHFIELTAVRQTAPAGIRWPSPGYAAELLAWDWFLGLALLFAAPIFGNHVPAEQRVRRGFFASGGLCLLGTAGPLVGDMRFQRIGILGYAIVLPIAFFWLAKLFRGR